MAPFAVYTGNPQVLIAPSVGVLWTLSFEWGLYLALPVITALRNLVGRATISIVGTLAFAMAMPHPIDGSYRFIFCFFLGFLAKDLRTFVTVRNSIKSLVAIACIVTALLTRNDPISVPNLLGIFVFFLMIVSGCTLYGLLDRKGIVRLGEVSYGIYLTHGPFVFMLTYLASKKSIITFFIAS